MSFSFNSQMCDSKYAIQIETDNLEQFLFMQDMARECVDGKHKKKENDMYTEDGLMYCSCGNEPFLVKNNYYTVGYDGWDVHCFCGKYVSGDSKSDAIYKWNNRMEKE